MYQLSTKFKQSLARLIGDRCTVKCSLNGVSVGLLWDTGAQVSILSSEWLEQNLPDAEILPINELVQSDLVVSAATGSPIPYKGWVA